MRTITKSANNDINQLCVHCAHFTSTMDIPSNVVKWISVWIKWISVWNEWISVWTLTWHKTRGNKKNHGARRRSTSH